MQCLSHRGVQETKISYFHLSMECPRLKESVCAHGHNCLFYLTLCVTLMYITFNSHSTHRYTLYILQLPSRLNRLTHTPNMLLLYGYPYASDIFFSPVVVSCCDIFRKQFQYIATFGFKAWNLSHHSLLLFFVVCRSIESGLFMPKFVA